MSELTDAEHAQAAFISAKVDAETAALLTRITRATGLTRADAITLIVTRMSSMAAEVSCGATRAWLRALADALGAETPEDRTAALARADTACDALRAVSTHDTPTQEAA